MVYSGDVTPSHPRIGGLTFSRALSLSIRSPVSHPRPIVQESALFFEGTDNVSMSLYARDINAVEKSVSCELHRASAAYRPQPPFSAHFEHIRLEIVGPPSVLST